MTDFVPMHKLLAMAEHQRDYFQQQADYYADKASDIANERDELLNAIRDFVTVGEATLRIFGTVGERIIQLARPKI